MMYATDLSEAQWQLLKPLIPAPKPGGRPAKYCRREIVNALLYVLRTGCPWRLLPHDFPPWKSVYGYFAKWRQDGTLEAIHYRLFVTLRLALGRHAHPSAGVIDSQSTKTTEKGGPEATTPARRSTAASGTWSSTRWAC
jgi:transposase